MKKPRPELELIARQQFIGNLKYWRTISRLWGKATLNGVETYWGRQGYYKGTVSPTFWEFADFVGIRKDLNHKTKGIKRAWLELSAARANKTLGDVPLPGNGVILDEINQILMSSDIEGTVFFRKYSESVDFFGGVRRSRTPLPAWFDKTNPDHPKELYRQWSKAADNKTTSILNWGSGAFAQREDFLTDIEKKFEDNSYAEMLLIFAAWTDELDVEITGPHEDNISDYRYESKPLYDAEGNNAGAESIKIAVTTPGWSFGIKIRKRTEELSLPLEFLDDMREKVNTVFPDFTDTTSASNPYAALWYNGRLRWSFYTYTGMKTEEKIDYFLAAIKSGYKKKKKRGIKKYLGVVVAIAIIVIATVFGGPAGFKAGVTAAGALGAWGVALTIVGIAFAITTIATIISMAIMIGNMMGLEEYMGPLASFMHMMNPIIRIASIITQVVGILTIVHTVTQNIANQAAQEAGREAASMTLKESVKMSIQAVKLDPSILTRVAISSMKSGFGSAMGSKFMLTQRIMSTANYIGQKHIERKSDKMQQKLNKEAQLLAQEQEVEEQFQTNHTLMALIRSAPLLLEAAEGEYVEIYDRPYEWWSTPYHTGCMQANTVHAMMYNSND